MPHEFNAVRTRGRVIKTILFCSVADGPDENQRHIVHLIHINTQQVFGLHDSPESENVRAQGDRHRPAETRDENWTGCH